MLVPDGVRDELGEVLSRDNGLLGDAYRRLLDDPGADTHSYHVVLLAAILDGTVPSAGTFRVRAAARAWNLLELELELSPAAREYLTGLLNELEDTPKPPAPVIADAASIYVYSLPSLIASPASPDDGRTWLKVGFTGGDPRARVGAQGRVTGLPEDPVLLRVYQGDGVDLAMERVFHEALVAFGHRRQNGKESGREWFLTSMVALDTLASITGLTVVYST